MATLTIDLPEPLVSELEIRSVSSETLNSVVQELLEQWLSAQFSNSIREVANQESSQSATEFIAESDAILSAQANEHEKMSLMEKASTDSQFLEDLHETMANFATVDSEWWEHI